MRKHLASTVVVCMVFALLSGCGYSIRQKPPIESVRLGEITNMTSQPKLQDRLYEALTTELMRRGIRIDDSSEYTIRGAIEDFSMDSLAEREGVTVQYQLRITGSFDLVRPDGAAMPLRKQGAFIVTFGGTGTLDRIMAAREVAVEEAITDIAEELAASITHLR